MLKNFLPTNLFSFEDDPKQKCIQPWAQQSRRDPKNDKGNEKYQNSQTNMGTNLKKGQSLYQKAQTSTISSQYHTVRQIKDKQSEFNENAEIKTNQNNPDYIDDDFNDFHELLQQFQALNISQILPLKLMQKQVMEDANAKRVNAKQTQPNEHFKKYQKNKKQKPEFIKLIKQINRQEKQEQRNRLFENLNQNEIKSLILGSYINKLLSDLSLKFLKQMPLKFPGSVRIPKEQKSFLLMFLQEVVEQVELEPSRFTPKGYKFKVEENVKETIEFSKKIQLHFTSAKINLIYKLTEAYKNMDYIHAEAKKILYRNLIKITKEHQQYKQKLRIKFEKAEKKVRNQQNSKQLEFPQKNMYTRSWAAQSQDCQFFELKSQKNKFTYESQANREDLKSLNGRIGRFCQEQDAQSIGLNSQNNCVFGYRSATQYPMIEIKKEKQVNIKMQKNSKRVYENQYVLNNIVAKSKQKQRNPNKLGQISRSLQKWKQRQRENMRSISDSSSRNRYGKKQQQTQTQGRKILKISKQTEFNFQPFSANINKQIVNVLYTETPQGQQPKLHVQKKEKDGQSEQKSHISSNLSSDEEEKGLMIQNKSKDSLSISLTTQNKISHRGQISIMNSTGQIDHKINQQNQIQKIIFVRDDSDDSSDESDDDSDQQQTCLQHNLQMFDLTKIIDAKIKSKDVTNNCILEKQEDQRLSSQSSHEQIPSTQVEPILGKPMFPNPQLIIKDQSQSFQPHQKDTYGNELIKKENKQQKMRKGETNVSKKNLPPIPPSNSNPNLQPYRKLSEFLKGRLLPEICQQFQSYFATYYNSKPAFHVQKRRKLLDFVFEVCQEVEKARNSAKGVLESDKSAKLGIELCKLINEPKMKSLKNISLKYYKDYFPVEEKREMFQDVKSIINLFRLYG